MRPERLFELLHQMPVPGRPELVARAWLYGRKDEQWGWRVDVCLDKKIGRQPISKRKFHSTDRAASA